MITQLKQQLAVVKLKYEWKIKEIKKRQYFLTTLASLTLNCNIVSP